MAEYINKADIVKLINDSFFDLGVSDDRTNMLTEVEELPTVTINDTSDENIVTKCNDNISRQALCDALDKTFADRIKMFDYDSYEKADEKTQLVCDGIMKAIDVVLGLPSAQQESAIPLSWIREQIEWLESLDNAFSTLTAGQISAMVNKWKDEQHCSEAERRDDA